VTIWDDTHTEPSRGDPAQPVRKPSTAPVDGEGAGLDLSIFGMLAFHLGRMVDDARAEHDRRARLAAAVPQDHQPVAQGIVNAAGNLLLDLGSVPVGRVWEVRRIVIGGALATAAPTGHAWALASGAPPAALVTTSIMDSWPSFATGAAGSSYGTHQFFLLATEHLWVAVTGATPTAQWVASARIEDFDAEAYYARGGGAVS
jgi:hypothetical protein